MSTEAKTTPMMEQWLSVKKKAKDALLFFRLGDFYEAFYEDAQLISKELGLTLTKRQDIPMCGVPYHTSDNYVDKLVAKGYKVAIADQIEDPKLAKGLVKRELTRIVTPGTVITSTLLQERSNNFFAAISQDLNLFGLAILDLTTADFKTYELEDKKALFDEISKIRPKEILISKKFKESNSDFVNEIEASLKASFCLKEEWHFDYSKCSEELLGHLKARSLESFGLKKCSAVAAGSLLSYLKEDLSLNLDHVQAIKCENLSQYMSLDHTCLRNLEILEPLYGKERRNTLVELLDKSSTPMGGRLLREWLKHPLLSPEKIKERQDAIEELIGQSDLTSEIGASLEEVRDFERLMMKISSNYASPKDVAALRYSLEKLPSIRSALNGFSSPLLREALNEISEETEALELIKKSLTDEPPFRLSDGGVFKEGFDPALDELRLISRDSRAWIAGYQNRLREETGVKSLKVGYTKAFGYYIDVSSGKAEKIPPSFQRKQTLINSERFITEELKLFEEKVLSAEEKIRGMETALFTALRLEIVKYQESIKKSAKALALLDAILSLCKTAKKYNYVRPVVEEEGPLFIKNGRHPIIENGMHGAFVPNDVRMDEDNLLMIITGPNMSGKSTYIRQVALIAIMAQIGSFIPADSAHIAIVDKVFARIGASDDLARGQSTFMVEMTEAAAILNCATSRSLIILDEIGRGTSTYDGISIAWAIAEYLLVHKRAKTLFATHYWELTELEKRIKGAKNFNVAVIETDKEVVFLRKIVAGGTDKSYGIHVAKLAGVPGPVIRRAEETLKLLENNAAAPKKIEKEKQLDFVKEPDPVLQSLKADLRALDLNALSPIDAHLKLFEIKKKLLS